MREGRLIALAVENLVYGTFEDVWNRLDLTEKKKLALDGLYRGACTCTRDNGRHICPEMTVDGLVGDGEYNLINLLKRIMGHDPTGNGRVKELFLFVHPWVEREYEYTEKAPDLLKAFLYEGLLLRNSFILATLIGILEEFLDRSVRPDYRAKVSARPRPEDRKLTARMAHAKNKKAGIRVDDSQLKEQNLDPIGYLSEPDSQSQDYHFDTTYGHTTSIQITHPPGARPIFIVARRRAMASGSLSALYMMLTILECQCFRAITDDQIHRQLKSGYQLTVTDAGREIAWPFPPPTSEELDEERAYLQQRLARVLTRPNYASEVLNTDDHSSAFLLVEYLETVYNN
ncbi:hypothetical protein DFH09DRAFT_1367513 [Mycena vulgaris]|nr:hypothetical protein DFH09DRAFT_1367513 [Mycena vulgaris]